MEKEKKSLEEIADIFNNSDIQTTPYIEIPELTDHLTNYDKFSESFDIIFDFYSFQKLSTEFNEQDIFNAILNSPALDIDIKIKNIEKICRIFNKPQDEELAIFIIQMYRSSLNMISIMSTNLIYSQKLNGKWLIIPKEAEENGKEYHFYSPKIEFYDLRLSMNLRIKTLLENGETIESLSNLNIVFAVYMLLQLRSMGV